MGPTWSSSDVWHTVASEDKIPPDAFDRRQVIDGQLLKSVLAKSGEARVEIRVNLSQTRETVMEGGDLPGFLPVEGFNVVFRVVPISSKVE